MTVVSKGKGVKLETAYIELQLDDSKIDGQIKDSLDRAGTHAQDAGTKMGRRMRDGIREGMKDLGNDTKDIGKGVAEGVRRGMQNASPEFRKALDDAVQQAAAGMGQKVGGAIRGAFDNSGIGDAIRDQLGTVGTTITGQLGSVTDVVGRIRDDIGGIGNDGHQLDGLKNNLDAITKNLKGFDGKSTGLEGALGRIGAKGNDIGAIVQGVQELINILGDPKLNDLLGKIPGMGVLDNLINKYPQQAGQWGQRQLNNIFGPGTVPGNGGGMLGGGGSFGGSPAPNGGTLGSSWRDGIIGPGTGSPMAPASPHRGGNAPSGFRANAGAAGVVPAGAYNGPDASGGFPGWVNSIGQRFGLSPSTYGGHQTTDRHEAGFAPNPQHSNRGVDWGGPGTSTTAKQRLADFAQQHPELFEQVIWQNPDTGQTVTIAGGKLVPASYYANDLGGHRDHVHTRFSQGFSLDQLPSFDKGGPVPDDMDAQLHAGEHVLNPDEVKALGGPQGVKALLNQTGDDQQDPQAPEGGPERTEGYMPAAAASNAGGVAGTSSLAMLFNLGNQAAAGAIDTGASAAQMALSAMSFGAGGAAGGVGIQMAATEAKRAVSYGFQVGSILTDAAIEQIMPFGAPRWLGYDYTQFAPQLGISQIGTTTAEKAVDAQLQQAGVEDAPKGLDAAGMASQQPGGPVNAGALPGSQPVGQPVPKYGEQPAAQAPAPTIGTGPTPGGGTQTPTGPPSGAAASPPTGAPPVMGPPVPAPKPASDPLSSLIPLDFGGGLFDEGGEWKNNTWGLNTSGRSELVLTGAQADAMAAQPAKRGSDGDTYYISGMDADDVMKQVDKKKRLAAMRYTGRF